MANKKAALGIMVVLACAAVILWSIDTYIKPGYQCGTDSLERANKTKEVFDKYKSLFERQPNRPYIKRGFFQDENTGQWTDTWGIVIIVDEKVDQDMLPPGDRIPDSLEGVPVQIIPAEIANMVPPLYQGGFPNEVDVHANLVMSVRAKNRDLFNRHPFFNGVGLPYVEAGSERGNRIYGISMFVTEKVNPRTLPPEDRIPDCLEDVPVRITVKP